MSKRRRFLTFSLLILNASLLSGCAGMPLWGSIFGEDDSDWAENDPVAQAALSVRQENPGVALEAPWNSVQTPANRGIWLGMNMSAVRSILGEPYDIQTAGQTALGNQRWIYSNGYGPRLSSASKVIYFENGRVAGWETASSR